MLDIHEDPRPIKLIYFWIGILATVSYRIIIVLNFFEPFWVKAAWYVGTVGFIIYFWSRYKVVKQFHSLIEEQNLVEATQQAENINAEQKQALSFVVNTLDKTKAQLNYQIIFALSGLALAAGIILDVVA